jgi:hypothetical protein
LTTSSSHFDKNKKIKKNKKSHHGTPCSRQPAAKSPHTKAQRRRVCVNTTVRCNEKKIPFFGLTNRDEFKEKDGIKIYYSKLVAKERNKLLFLQFIVFQKVIRRINII